MTTLPHTRRNRFMLALATALTAAFASPPAVADDTDRGWLDGVFDGEIGARFWYGMGETGKNLYDTTGAVPVSRLTYRGLTSQSGEIYGQVNERNYFVKGIAGLGALMRGTLQDEDFEPVTDPYSSTDSSLHPGQVGYVGLDAGAYLVETGNARAGIFVGYNYMRQEVNAYGCTQTATNPDICVPAISDATAVISQRNDWHSLRLGVTGDVRFGRGWRLSGEAAILPFVALQGTDFHWLRICATAGCFTGGIPEDGTGWGYQLEAMLDYTVGDTFTFGVGGRYWHMQTNGLTHFEDHIVGGGGAPQKVDWSTDLFGLTAHAALRY